MIKESTINNVTVKPLVTVSNDSTKIKGYKLIPSLYGCTFLCAKRQSGKTSTLAEILKNTCDKNTKFFIFCPTHRVDSSWVALVDMLESKGSEVNLFDSLIEGKTNLLSEIIDDLQVPEDAIVKKGNDPVPIGTKLKFEDPDAIKQKKEYKPKKTAPKHIFVFDDISMELRNPAVGQLCKMSRHIKASVYISSQWVMDLAPQTIKQLSYFFCFRSFSRDKLEHIHKLLDLSIDLEKFYDIYDYVFKDGGQYDFLYIDVRNQKYRKNFNKEIVFDDI